MARLDSEPLEILKFLIAKINITQSLFHDLSFSTKQNSFEQYGGPA